MINKNTPASININGKPKLNEYTPSPRAHLIISVVKSFTRICAGIVLCYGSFVSAGLLIIAAECLGIAEELV